MSRVMRVLLQLGGATVIMGIGLLALPQQSAAQDCAECVPVEWGATCQHNSPNGYIEDCHQLMPEYCQGSYCDSGFAFVDVQLGIDGPFFCTSRTDRPLATEAITITLRSEDASTAQGEGIPKLESVGG